MIDSNFLTTFVYWLYDPEAHADPNNEGYIGITDNPRSRIDMHRRSGRVPNNFAHRILFQGSRNECLEKEQELRPYPKIGWNKHAGGGILPRRYDPTKPLPVRTSVDSLDHKYPSNYAPGTHWAIDDAWEILDTVRPGVIPDDVRFILAGMIAGKLMKLETTLTLRETGAQS